jgi:hypothetical protein
MNMVTHTLLGVCYLQEADFQLCEYRWHYSRMTAIWKMSPRLLPLSRIPVLARLLPPNRTPMLARLLPQSKTLMLAHLLMLCKTQVPAH